ncbi:hypothetical protein LA080_005059 [Diaporthe eres]|nr:hypothetical protein LA080_005059 [Diaporthe eres]
MRPRRVALQESPMPTPANGNANANEKANSNGKSGHGNHTAPPSCCKHETQDVLAEPASGANVNVMEMLPSYCPRVKAETDSDSAVWTDSAPSNETAISYEVEEKKGQKRKQKEGSTHEDGKSRQAGRSSIQFQACEASLMDPASFYECCHGMALTPISPLAQFDMIWVSLVFTILPFGCMEQAQMRPSASICAAMNAM